MNIAICEDEVEQQNILKKMIHNIDLKIPYRINIFSSGESLIKAYDNGLRFSIILLDMQMKEINGIKTAKIVRRYDMNCIIIIVTSILEYAVEGYGINAFDFILKPVGMDKFQHVMKRAIKKLQEYENQKYIIETREKTIVLKLPNILYVESNGRKVNIICEKENYVSNENITNIENKLIAKGFVRISRYFLVNMAHIKEVDVKEILLDNGKSLSMSNKLREKVKNQYMDYMIEGMI